MLVTETEIYRQAASQVFTPDDLPADLQLLTALNRLVNRKYKETRSPQYYSKALNVPLNRLNKLTLAYYNESLYQHLQSKVHQEVQNRLAHSTLSVKQIAIELGVTDAAYLCRQFKKRTGLKPSEYRRQYRMLVRPG